MCFDAMRDEKELETHVLPNKRSVFGVMDEICSEKQDMQNISEMVVVYTVQQTNRGVHNKDRAQRAEK